MNGRMFIRSDGSLYIERTLAEDTGTYVCTAVNVAGSTNITVNLEVQGRRLMKEAMEHLTQITCFTKTFCYIQSIIYVCFHCGVLSHVYFFYYPQRCSKSPFAGGRKVSLND